MRHLWFALLAVLVVAAAPGGADAQGRVGGAGTPQSGRAAAPRDLTGYWVSVVTENWHVRMTVPPRGDVTVIPVNAEARKILNAWDPAKEPSGEECRAYGAAAIMRVPSRLYINWADDNTLQMDIDSGTQTRRFRFGGGAPPANQPLDWQGYSVAQWVGLGARSRGAAINQLKVTTTRMRPGYLRKNGIPYSANATMEEYFDRFTEPNGDEWLVVTSIITDPQYLAQPYVTSTPFKKIPDRSGWDPTPCRADQVR